MKMTTWLAETCDICFITVYPAVFTTIRYKRSILSNTTLQCYTTTCYMLRFIRTSSGTFTATVSTTQANSNKSPTTCNNLSVYYPDVYLQLNMFRALSRPTSGVQWLQWQPLVLPSYRGESRVVFVVGDDSHHDTKVKPETATTVIELLMMGGKTPKTCWAVNTSR